MRKNPIVVASPCDIMYINFPLRMCKMGSKWMTHIVNAFQICNKNDEADIVY